MGLTSESGSTSGLGQQWVGFDQWVRIDQVVGIDQWDRIDKWVKIDQWDRI